MGFSPHGIQNDIVNSFSFGNFLSGLLSPGKPLSPYKRKFGLILKEKGKKREKEREINIILNEKKVASCIFVCPVKSRKRLGITNNGLF